MIVHADTSAPAPRILYFAQVPMAEGATPEEKKEKLKKALPPIDYKTPPAVKVTWEEGMVFRLVILPDMPESDLKKAFLWEMKEKYSLNEENSLIGSECVLTLDQSDGVKEKFFSVFYCDKKAAMEKVALVTGLGLRVSSLAPNHAALAQGLGNLAGPEKDLLIFDIGSANARILPVRQKKNMFSRTVQLGGQALTDMLAGSYMDNDQKIQLSPGEAEKLKITEGCSNPQAGHISLVRPYLEKVVSEIKRSVDFYESQKYSKPISKIVFTGGGSNLKGLGSFMKSFLGLEVLALEPSDSIAPQIPREQEEFVTNQFGFFYSALGAAAAPTDSPLNLLPREVKFEKREKTKKMSFRMIFLASALVMGFMVLSASFQLHIARVRLKTAFLQTGEVSRVLDLLGSVQSDDRFMRSALKNDLSHPPLFKALSRLAPPGLILDEISFNRESNTYLIRGSTNASGSTNVKVIAQFIGDLQKTPFFKEVTLARTSKDPEGLKLSFELNCVTRGLL